MSFYFYALMFFVNPNYTLLIASASSDGVDLRCGQDSDCTIVNSACKVYTAQAISLNAANDYERKMKEKCKKEMGLKASMSTEGPVRVNCINQICVLKKSWNLDE